MFFGSAFSAFVVELAELSLTDIWLAIPIAWLALGVMTNAWIQNSRTHWLWLILGLVTGLPLTIVFMLFLMFYFTLVGLASYLVYWHLTTR